MADTIYCKDCAYHRTTDVRSVKHYCIGPPTLPAKCVDPFETCKHAIKKKEKENAR